MTTKTVYVSRLLDTYYRTIDFDNPHAYSHGPQWQQQFRYYLSISTLINIEYLQLRVSEVISTKRTASPVTM